MQRDHRSTLSPRVLMISCGVALLALPRVAASAPLHQDTPELPKAELLLDRHVKSTGGKKAHLAIRSRRKIGKLAVDLAGHSFEAEVEERYLAPDRSHVLVQGEFFFQVTVCNGEHAWDWRPGPTPEDGGQEDPGTTSLLEGDARIRSLEKAKLHAAVHWREEYKKVKTIGLIEVGERPAYQVRIEDHHGQTFTQSYDQATGRLVRRVTTTMSQHSGKLEMEVLYQDYAEFDGVWLPRRVHANLNSKSHGKGTQTWTFSRIQHDAKISKKLFEIPPELAKLIEEAAEDDD